MKWHLPYQKVLGRGHPIQTPFQIGDVVWVIDPIDNTTQHPMRIMAIEGDSIQYLNDGFLLNGRRIPVLDMREWSSESRGMERDLLPISR